MIKKLLIGLGIGITTFFLIDKVIYADGLEKELIRYLESNKLDFLGRNFDKIFFNTLYGENPTALDKLKAIPEELKTLPLQSKCLWKIVNQKPNALTYGTISGLAGLKIELGSEAFNKLMLKVLRVIVK